MFYNSIFFLLFNLKIPLEYYLNAFLFQSLEKIIFRK